MKRYVIKINESKCTGCSKCIDICVSQALQIIEGKAKLVSDTYCDGFGTCIKSCPYKAMNLELREADSYSEAHVLENISEQGEIAVEKHLSNLDNLGQKKYIDDAMLYMEEKSFSNNCCKSHKEYDYNDKSMTKTLIKEMVTTANSKKPCKWPIRLDILYPDADYLNNADLVLSADCVPFVYKDFKKKFLKDDKVLIILCPKDENTIGSYIGKLSYIFEHKNIHSISIVQMESECCNEVVEIVKKALQCIQITMFVKVYTISLSGELV